MSKIETDEAQKIWIMQNKILKLNSFSYLFINPVKKIEKRKKIVEMKQRMLIFKAFIEYSIPISLPKFPNK